MPVTRGCNSNKSALAITGAIQGSSQEKLDQKLGLEHLHQRRWIRQLSLFLRFFITKFLNISIDLFHL